jgi:glycine/D-amino acid oxidase-like deaminating enzyme
VADRLAADGATVTVVDAVRSGSGTSGSSFAWLDSNGKLPRHYHDLSVRAMDAWARLADGFRAAELEDRSYRHVQREKHKASDARDRGGRGTLPVSSAA